MTKNNNIIEGIDIIDLGIWLPKHKVLAFSDFHIGYEEALNTRGILIPRHQLSDTLDRLRKIFAHLKEKPDTIIINGDLKHEFGSVNKEEFFGVRDLLNLLAKNCNEVILLEGNHDKILGYTKSNPKVKIKTDVLIGNVLFAHGDVIIQNPNSSEADTIVIGHAHPALKLSDGIINEKVKCFLKGNWKNKTLIALPSFNLVTEGTDVLSEGTLSPYLEESKNTEAWAVPNFNEVLYFGKLRKLRGLVN